RNSATFPVLSRRSRYRSSTSAATFVAPHAMYLLRPMATAGTPGSVAPITSKSPADMCARYHVDGARVPRCGSLASSGLPLAVSVPSTTQLFEPSASDAAPPRSKSRTAGEPCDRVAANSDNTDIAGLLPRLTEETDGLCT